MHLSHEPPHLHCAAMGKAESEVMVASRTGANLVWHPVTTVPSRQHMWLGELDEGVGVVQQDYLSAKEHLLLYIPYSALNNLLQGSVLRTQDIQRVESSDLENMVVVPNGQCVLQLLRDSKRGFSQLDSHRYG